MTTDRTAELRVWRGHRERYDSPDETHDVPVHERGTYQSELETLTLCDDISVVGWLGFEVGDLPDGVDEVTLYVHADDSFNHPRPLDSRAVERGLVFDGDPYTPGVDPFVCRLAGIVECYVREGSR
jgi:hypothetical protein